MLHRHAHHARRRPAKIVVEDVGKGNLAVLGYISFVKNAVHCLYNPFVKEDTNKESILSLRCFVNSQGAIASGTEFRAASHNAVEKGRNLWYNINKAMILSLWGVEFIHR